MADDTPNIIKPVDSLHNIAVLAPARRREQRNRRQEPHKEDEEAEKELNKPDDESTAGDKSAENENDQHTVDYQA